MASVFSHAVAALGIGACFCASDGQLFQEPSGEALQIPKEELDRAIDSATHLIYHAIFADSVGKTRL